MKPATEPSVTTAEEQFAHPLALRVWVLAVLGASVVAAVALTLTQGDEVPWLTVGLFAVLCAAAENVAVVWPNRSSCSVSVMVALAAVVVFRGDAPLLAPLLVGMASGIYLPHLRDVRTTWPRLALNTGMFGLATLAAAAAYGAIATSNSATSVAVLATLAGASAYWFANMPTLAVTLSLRDGTRFRTEFFALWGFAELEIVVFAMVGLGLGLLYQALGAWILVMSVAPILIARQSFAAYLTLRRAHQGTLDTLIMVLEAKDPYTAGHVARVATFADYMGREIGLSPRRLRILHDAALLHDIGKLIVPNQILNKPGKLTESEYAIVRRHEVATVQMLQRIEELAPSAPAVATADLSGPIESRIVHVADAFDAMTSTRAYRRALTHEAAVHELRDKSGTQFDPVCVDALLATLARRGERHGAGERDETPHFESAPVAGVGSAGLGDLATELV